MTLLAFGNFVRYLHSSLSHGLLILPPTLVIPCLFINEFRVDSLLSLPKDLYFCLIFWTSCLKCLFCTNLMIALLASCNISILTDSFVVAYCFNLTCISRICVSCRIIATSFLNFSQLENFASSFDNKSHSIVAKFTIKVAFTSGSLPFTSTETCVGHSLADFHKNPGPSNHLFVFSEFTSFNPLELSSAGFSLVDT